MFRSIMKTAMVAALVATGAAATGAATATPAAAGSLSYELRIDGPHGGVRVGKNRYAHRPAFRYRDRGVCRPFRAVRKARRMGIHRAHIVRVNPRRVVVRGRVHGAPIRVVFANRASCPVIAYR